MFYEFNRQQEAEEYDRRWEEDSFFKRDCIRAFLDAHFMQGVYVHQRNDDGEWVTVESEYPDWREKYCNDPEAALLGEFPDTWEQVLANEKGRYLDFCQHLVDIDNKYLLEVQSGKRDDPDTLRWIQERGA